MFLGFVWPRSKQIKFFTIGVFPGYSVEYDADMEREKCETRKHYSVSLFCFLGANYNQMIKWLWIDRLISKKSSDGSDVKAAVLLGRLKLLLAYRIENLNTQLNLNPKAAFIFIRRLRQMSGLISQIVSWHLNPRSKAEDIPLTISILVIFLGHTMNIYHYFYVFKLWLMILWDPRNSNIIFRVITENTLVSPPSIIFDLKESTSI